MNKNLSLYIIVIIFLIIINFPVACASGKSPVVRISFTLNEKIIPGANTSKVLLTVLIPQSLKYRQKILNINYSTPPQKIMEANGNKYAYFVIDNPKSEVNIDITVDAELYNYDLNKAIALPQKDFVYSQSLQEFLKVEPSLEFDNPIIQEAAKSINYGNSDLDTIQNIFNFTANTINFGGYNPESTGAIQALTSKSGDCTEYSDLFVALCRAKGIPARVIYGFTTNWSDTPKHAWVEAYSKQYGWVAFDPTMARNNLNKFPVMDNRYIYFSYCRNDNILNGYYYAYYHYYGDPIQFFDNYIINYII